MAPLEEKEKLNADLYHELTDGYEASYCNPAYAVAKLGEEYGAFLCALRAELRSLIAFAFEQKIPTRLSGNFYLILQRKYKDKFPDRRR